jgi:hypothetical protein
MWLGGYLESDLLSEPFDRHVLMSRRLELCRKR